MTVEHSHAPLLEYQGPSPLRKPPVWPAYAFIGVMLVYQFVLGIGLGIALGTLMALRLFGLESRDDLRTLIESPPFILALLGAVAIINLGLAAGYLTLTRRVPLRITLKRRGRGTVLSLLIIILGALAVSRLFSVLAYWLSFHSHASQTFARLVTTDQHAYVILAFILVGILGPIAEEVIFRGCIQPRLIRRHGPLAGILVTSFFFGLYHWEIVQGFFAFTIGLYLGVVAHRTGSILCPILCHMANNTLSLSVSCFQLRLGSYAAIVAALVVCPVIVAAAAYLLYRIPRESAPRRRLTGRETIPVQVGL